MSRLEVLLVENFVMAGPPGHRPLQEVHTCIIGPNGSGNSGPRMSSRRSRPSRLPEET